MDKRRRTYSEGKKFSEEHTPTSQLHREDDKISQNRTRESGYNLRQEDINLAQLLSEIKPSIPYFINGIFEIMKGINIIMSALFTGNYRKKLENFNILLPWITGIITKRMNSTKRTEKLDGEKLVNAVVKGLEEEAEEIINKKDAIKEEIFKAHVLNKVAQILKKQVEAGKGELQRIDIE